MARTEEEAIFYFDPEARVECYDNGEGGVTVVAPAAVFMTPLQAERFAQALIESARSARDGLSQIMLHGDSWNRGPSGDQRKTPAPGQ